MKLRFGSTLKSKFVVVFGHPPDVFARSPGRLNLIGEHIVYEGYSVLPMAIRQNTIVAIRKHGAGASPKQLRIVNVDDNYTLCTYEAYPEHLISSLHISSLSSHVRWPCPCLFVALSEERWISVIFLLSLVLNWG